MIIEKNNEIKYITCDVATIYINNRLDKNKENYLKQLNNGKEFSKIFYNSYKKYKILKKETKDILQNINDVEFKLNMLEECDPNEYIPMIVSTKDIKILKDLYTILLIIHDVACYLQFIDLQNIIENIFLNIVKYVILNFNKILSYKYLCYIIGRQIEYTEDELFNLHILNLLEDDKKILNTTGLFKEDRLEKIKCKKISTYTLPENIQIVGINLIENLIKNENNILTFYYFIDDYNLLYFKCMKNFKILPDYILINYKNIFDINVYNNCKFSYQSTNTNNNIEIKRKGKEKDELKIVFGNDNMAIYGNYNLEKDFIMLEINGKEYLHFIYKTKKIYKIKIDNNKINHVCTYRKYLTNIKKCEFNDDYIVNDDEFIIKSNEDKTEEIEEIEETEETEETEEIEEIEEFEENEETEEIEEDSDE